MKLPDFEAWAIFAKVAHGGSFAGTAAELGLSKATVSKAVGRLESQLGTALFHRTSRRLALTESGRAALEPATRILLEGEALQSGASAQSLAPRGPVRMAAPMSFGIAHLGSALAAFSATYPEVSVELSLSDERVDLVDSGFDLALRIGTMPDSSLRIRRLCQVRVLLTGAPAYFARQGMPSHPRDLAAHTVLFYTNTRPRGVWRFTHPAEGQTAVKVAGPLQANNADVMRPALLAGLGLARMPDFLVWDDIAAGRLQVALPDWSGEPLVLHLVMPPSTIRPARVDLLIDFLARHVTAPRWAAGLGSTP